MQHSGIRTAFTLVMLTALTACGSGSADGEGSAGTSGSSDGARDVGGSVKLPDTSGESSGGLNPVAPGTDFETCTGIAEESENTYAPADIVFLVDNSPSMRDEILWTRQNMNEFSRTIAEKGMNPRIIMVSCLLDCCDGHPNTTGICIDPPVGNGDCTTSDSNPPDYLHVDIRMPSQKLLQRAISTYPSWQSQLRSFALTHFIAISDDGELWTAADFQSQLATLNPPLSDYVFHGIFSSMSKEAACEVSGTQPCCRYAAPGGEGVAYRDLSTATGGVAADLCAQDFSPVFAQFAQSVIAHSELNCEWVIPPPPAGQTLDPNLVNVKFTSGGSASYFRYVPTSGDCSIRNDAWYYDNRVSPTRVFACPSTCERIRSATTPSIAVSFGCQTLQATPLI